jgi:hypothetical protein
LFITGQFAAHIGQPFIMTGEAGSGFPLHLALSMRP